MALGLSTAFTTLFDAEVKSAYQATSVLRGTTRMRVGVEGNTIKFPKIGKGVATQRIPQADVTPLNVTYSQVSMNMVDYNAAEYSDIFNQQKVNFVERSELVQVVSNAIGRRLDQLILDAINASSTSLTVANSIGGSNTNINVAKLRRVKKLMDTNNVPPDGRFMCIHAAGLEGLLGETQATSVDYNSVRALVSGEVNSFLGMTFIVLGDRSEGGLAVDGSLDRTCFAWHKDAVGYGEGIGMRSEITYIAEKTSWLVNALFSANAVAIDDEGIVKITARES